MATVFAATVANRWFVRRRGLVVGLLTAASATGQLIFLPFLGWLAQERGWRYVSLTVAICTLAVVPLVVVFLRDRPEDAKTRAYGASEDDPPAPERGNPIAMAFRGLALASGNRNFWLLAATFFICGASTNGLIGTHLIPAGVDHGMAEVTAASLLAVIGIFDVVGTTISGVLTDRVDSRKLLFAYYGLRGLSLLYLPVAFRSPSFALILFIVFYGLDWVATVPPTVAIASQTFGRAAGPIVYGWIFTSHQLGAAVAASAAGVIRTVTGGYELAFIGSGLLCLLAAGLCLFMRRAGETESATPLLPDAPLVRPAGGT
jgi:predicted MFS family arabinose efflux permease